MNTSHAVMTALLAAMLLLSGCPGGSGYSSRADTERRSNVQHSIAVNTGADEAAGDASLKNSSSRVEPDRREYRIGEEAQVRVRLAEAEAAKAWVEIVPETAYAKANGDLHYPRADSDPTLFGYREYRSRSRAADDYARFERFRDYHRYYLSGSDLLKIRLPYLGSYYLRLWSDARSGPVLLAQSELIVVRQWPEDYYYEHPVPFLWLDHDYDEVVLVDAGQALRGYYYMPQGYPRGSWLGLVPVDDRGNVLDDLVRVLAFLDDGDWQDIEFSWMPQLPGRYILRVYPERDYDGYYLAQSGIFQVADRGVSSFRLDRWIDAEEVHRGWEDKPAKAQWRLSAAEKSKGHGLGRESAPGQQKLKNKGGGQGTSKGHGKGSGKGPKDKPDHGKGGAKGDGKGGSKGEGKGEGKGGGKDK